jgi:hypothetical protein
MLEGEQRLSFRLARGWATGVGAIVDLGCIAGGSAAILAEGRGQPCPALPGRAHDAFRISGPLKARCHPETQASRRGPIERLAMDASSTAATTDAMATAFLPEMVAGPGVLIQRGFLLWHRPWIAVQMVRRDGCSGPAAPAPRDTVVIRCLRAPSAEEVEAADCTGSAVASTQATFAASRAKPFGSVLSGTDEPQAVAPATGRSRPRRSTACRRCLRPHAIASMPRTAWSIMRGLLVVSPAAIVQASAATLAAPRHALGSSRRHCRKAP